jgi:hypothetical protein
MLTFVSVAFIQYDCGCDGLAPPCAATRPPRPTKEVGEDVAGKLRRVQFHRCHEIGKLLVNVVPQLAALGGTTVHQLALLGALQEIEGKRGFLRTMAIIVTHSSGQ